MPLAASAAMQTANQASPFYCGKLSAPMLSQLRSMDLPAELLRQALPDNPAKHCKACVVASTDDVLLSTSVTLSAAVRSTDAYLATPVADHFLFPPQHFQARAPPQ